MAASDGRLVTFPLDVSDRAAVFDGVARAIDAFGRLDVVVNNAGRAMLGIAGAAWHRNEVVDLVGQGSGLCSAWWRRA